MIVPTIEVPAGMSLPQLHRVVLACFGWSGECLHVFEIRGWSYSDSGYVDAERSTDVTIGSLGLRIGERFVWRYDFCSDWVIDIRVQTASDIDAVGVVSGRRAGPPGWVGGSERFAVWEDSHHDRSGVLRLEHPTTIGALTRCSNCPGGLAGDNNAVNADQDLFGFFDRHPDRG